MKTTSTIRRIVRTAAAGFAVLMLTATGVALTPSAPSAQATGCHYFWAQTFTSARHSNGTAGTFRVPYTSGCRDINVRYLGIASGNPYTTCGYFRVHFYPTSGADYSNSWKKWCLGDGPKVLAWGVRDGTLYDIESQGFNNEFSFQVYD